MKNLYKNLLKKIVKSIKNKVINLFSIRSSIENIKGDFLNKINRINQINLSTAFLHQRTFLKFKNIHFDKEIVIFATGPSADRYIPIDNAIHIGVNRAFEILKHGGGGIYYLIIILFKIIQVKQKSILRN